MNKLLSCFALILLYQVLPAQEVTIPGSQTKQIASSLVSGQDYTLHIQLPSDYAKTDKVYPVVYLLDSQWDFPLVTTLYGEQYYDGFVPPLIIVGVTWGGDKPDAEKLRTRDYTPTHTESFPLSGGAEKYLSFMKDELIPFVEKNYRADKNDRTLMGCSLGGLFTMYALFTEPGLFQRYVAASPAISWDHDVLYSYEKKYAEKPFAPPAKLFLCIGGVELSAPAFQKFVTLLRDRHHASLTFESRVLENTGHSGTKGEGYARGLQFVFKRPAIPVSDAVLDKYVGNYRLPDGTVHEIKRENHQLVVQAGDSQITLYSTGDHEFYATALFLKIKFEEDKNGHTTGAQVETFGATNMAKKL